MYFISFATVNWIDVFTRKEYKDEILKSWQHCQQKKGLEIYAWCIMPSHVHMIISSHDKPLEGIVRDIKSHTSSGLKKLIKGASAGKQTGMDSMDLRKNRQKEQQ